MDKSDIVIIGGVACGCKTAASLARKMPQAKITLFQKEKYLSYATCGLPYLAGGDVENFQQLISTPYNVVRDENYFANSKGVKAMTETEVLSIDRENKSVEIKDLKSGEIKTHGYNKLVLATGARPNGLPLDDLPETSRISTFTRPDDAFKFRQMAQSGQIGSAIIIGGGYIGCKVAEACASLWGIEATLIEKENQVFPWSLDFEMARKAEKEMKTKGVDVNTGKTVTKVEGNDENGIMVTLDDSTIFKADCLYICSGLKANTELAVKAKLEVGTTGGLLVNEYMQTSDPDIYAGGDCVEQKHRVSGQPVYISMGSLANRHGIIIADHISGGSLAWPGTLGTFMVRVFDLNAGSVGLSQAAAEKAGLDVIAVWGTFADKPDYYPESNLMSLKMIVNKKDNSLVGFQGVGPGDVARLVDVFSVYMQNGCKLEDILHFEHGYAPQYSEAISPLHHLASLAGTIEQGFEQLNPANLPPKDDDTFFLDVREGFEIEAMPFPAENVVNIPLNDLKANLDKLDKNKRILIICSRGPRAYQAAHFLKNAGFERFAYFGGGYFLVI
jgi:NADPH-dependent 2,4-dienoyl-CoA reductase/sulfur reductase-like enzyme/rhodanese-related sulfurtransferase